MVENNVGDTTRVHFLQAASLFRQGQHVEAAPLLVSAADAGDPEAQNLLGVMYLNALGVERDTRRAAELFAAAAQSGLKEGHYNLSNLQFNSIGVSRDQSSAQQHLLAAAQAGHRPALRSLGYMYHLMGGVGDWPVLASECFLRAALMGDPISKYNLGIRLWRGHGAPADPALAAYWLAAAAQDGILLAPARLQTLQNEFPTIATSLAPLDQASPMPTLPSWTFADLEMPHLANSRSFLSEYSDVLDEYLCDHLINVGSPQLIPSGVVDPLSGAPLRSELRTSYSMHYKLSMYDAVIARIWARLSLVAGLPAEHAEPLVVLRYAPGQEYKEHRDYFTDPKSKAQRLVTVFVYLNDVEEGGDTAFPILGISVRPERGKAVKFLNCDEGGRANPDTLHAGMPVLRGEKWLATLWFQDRPFDWFT